MKFQWFGVNIDTDKYQRQKPKSKQYFTIGDPVVYPGGGIGVIQEIKCIHGIDYFVIQTIQGSLRILVPMHKIHQVGATLLE